MVKKSVIEKKIRTINEGLQFLGTHEATDFNTFKNDLTIQGACLFFLEKSIQALIDIVMHIISDEGWGVHLHAGNTAELLARHHVISDEHVNTFIQIYGFRNRLVHGYEDVDLRLAHEIVVDKKKDIRIILDQILTYLGI